MTDFNKQNVGEGGPVLSPSPPESETSADTHSLHLGSLKAVLDMTALALELERFTGSTSAVVTALASRLACDRVSLGIATRNLELAEHHGRTLAYSVIAAMNTGERPISGAIRAAIGDVELTRNAGKPGHNYPVQVVQLGEAVTLAALGSEATVDYALRLKREISSPMVWVAGYSND